MARVYKADGTTLLGYLDDPRCRGPLANGVRHVKFDAWFRGREWFHENPGPAGKYQPKTEPKVIEISAWPTREGDDVSLYVQSYYEDFIKSLPGFTPVTP
jgi:hypothetical protein